MKIQILMATMSRKKLSDIDWSKKNIKSNVLVINQSNLETQEISSNMKMISNKELGSSKSRNLAIQNAQGDICIIADDDVSYLPYYEKTIFDAYKKYSDADIITFQIQTTEGKPFKEGYLRNDKIHNKYSILKCASIEITFKRAAIINSGIKLDLEFGLGSRYRVHDEIIFLKDALDAGLKCVYIPIPIVVHPPESSGTDYNEYLLHSKGAAFYRLFGNYAYLFNIAFTIKKYLEYKDKFSLKSCLSLMNRGTNEYKKEH